MTVSRAIRALKASASPLISLSAAFLVAGVLIAASGGSPLTSLTSMLAGAFGSASAFGDTLVKTTPLILTGLAVALGLRAGLFNIGAEGQLILGGLAAAWVGYALTAPAFIHIPLCLLAGMAVGGIWGGIAGVLKAKRGVHEVISTIMLNYIAFHLAQYMVTNPMKDASTMSPQTPGIAPTAGLGTIGLLGNVHWGILISLLCVGAFAFVMRRTVFGYELRIAGSAPEAARAAGISVGAMTVRTLLLSGAFAGLAGAVEVMGVHHRFYSQFSPGYGFDSIAVALLGNNTAFGTALSALFFGALRNGAVSMQIDTNTPKEIVTIIQAVVIIFAGIRFVRVRGSQPTPPT